MNQLDAYFQNLVPTVMVPTAEPLVELDAEGHRFLAAADGLWLEVKRPWLHLIWPVAQQSIVAMPYGALTKKCVVAAGSVPKGMLQQFAAEACRTPQVECAAWLLWDEQRQQYQYQTVEVLRAGPRHISYNRPVLADHEHLVVDMHSHGQLQAFFSGEDNEDDAGEVKFSFVVGQCDLAQPSQVMRLCALGLFIDVPLDQS